MHDKYLNYLKELYKELNDFNKTKIPLCAAENYLSDFINEFKNENFNGLYAMGNLQRDEHNDFIGSKFVFKLYDILSEQCQEIFNSNYADARTLSGMNCDLLVFMALLNCNDRVIITTPEQGGHASVPKLLNALNIQYDEIPYDYEGYQINYNSLNEILKTKKYRAIIFCQSDLIQPPDLSQCIIPEDIYVIYDATQTLGLIAGKVLPSPLALNNCILIGGTHKTLPGPTCGLILCNNKDIISRIDTAINPNFLRNVQPDKINQLILMFIELQEFGFIYEQRIVDTANALGNILQNYGFTLAKIDNEHFSNTHQLFLLMEKSMSETLFENALRYNVTLNKKEKKLFNGAGIRIGTQQIARYCWSEHELKLVAQLLVELSKDTCDESIVLQFRKLLIDKKNPFFTHKSIIIE